MHCMPFSLKQEVSSRKKVHKDELQSIKIIIVTAKTQSLSLYRKRGFLAKEDYLYVIRSSSWLHHAHCPFSTKNIKKTGRRVAVEKGKNTPDEYNK